MGRYGANVSEDTDEGGRITKVSCHEIGLHKTSVKWDIQFIK